MNVKINTKEKFSVLTPEVDVISANMTAEVRNLANYAHPEVPHLVINLSLVNELTEEAAIAFSELQQAFYEQDRSLVICEMQLAVRAVFEKTDLLDLMNVTPTESEAWDIVQMEEIERELLNDFDKEEP